MRREAIDPNLGFGMIDARVCDESTARRSWSAQCPHVPPTHAMRGGRQTHALPDTTRTSPAGICGMGYWKWAGWSWRCAARAMGAASAHVVRAMNPHTRRVQPRQGTLNAERARRPGRQRTGPGAASHVGHAHVAVVHVAPRRTDLPTFRHKCACGTSAAQVRHKCGTSAEQARRNFGAQLRSKCGASAEQVRSTVRIACGTGAECRRMCGAAPSAKNDQKRLFYVAITQNGKNKQTKKNGGCTAQSTMGFPKRKEFGGCPCESAADPLRRLRNGGGTGAAPVRKNRCGTGAGRVRNGCGTGAERVRNGCGQPATLKKIAVLTKRFMGEAADFARPRWFKPDSYWDFFSGGPSWLGNG